jgi:hypothetical protein
MIQKSISSPFCDRYTRNRRSNQRLDGIEEDLPTKGRNGIPKHPLAKAGVFICAKRFLPKCLKLCFLHTIPVPVVATKDEIEEDLHSKASIAKSWCFPRSREICQNA